MSHLLEHSLEGFSGLLYSLNASSSMACDDPERDIELTAPKTWKCFEPCARGNCYECSGQTQDYQCDHSCHWQKEEKEDEDESESEEGFEQYQEGEDEETEVMDLDPE